MTSFKEREKSVNFLYDSYFGSRRFSLIAILPRTDSKPAVQYLKDKATPEDVESSTNTARLELLKFLADGYLEQYRHYDNQRAKLAGILVAAVAGFSLAPFALGKAVVSGAKFSPDEILQFQDTLITGSSVALFFVSLLAIFAARKHRLRMKQAYTRYKEVLQEIDNPTGKKITDLHRDAGKKAEKKFREETIFGEEKKGEMTRGMIWTALPFFVMLYSIIFVGSYFILR